MAPEGHTRVFRAASSLGCLKLCAMSDIIIDIVKAYSRAVNAYPLDKRIISPSLTNIFCNDRIKEVNARKQKLFILCDHTHVMSTSRIFSNVNKAI